MALCKNGVARAKVRAANDKPSVLYNDLLKHYGNRDTALNVYGSVNSDNFKTLTSNQELGTDVNGEPKLEDVLSIIDNNPTLLIEDDLGYHPGDTSDSIDEGYEDSIPEVSESEDVVSEEYEDADAGYESSAPTASIEDYLEEELDGESNKPKVKKSNSLSIGSSTLSHADRTRYNSLRSAIDSINKDIESKVAQLNSLKDRTFNDEDKSIFNNLVKEISQLRSNKYKTEKEFNAYQDAVSVTDISTLATKNLKIISNILAKDKLTESDKKFIDSQLGVWLNADRFFATSDDTQAERAILDSIAASAASIERSYVNSLDNQFSKEIKEGSSEQMPEGTEVSYSILRELTEKGDENIIHAFTLSIDRNDNKAFQMVNKIIEGGELRMMSRVYDFDKLIDKAFKGVDSFDILSEKYKDGKATGNLIHYISPEFREIQDKHIESIKDKSAEERYADNIAFINNNKVFLDPSILFHDKLDHNGDKLFKGYINGDIFNDALNISKDDIKAHEELIKKHLGGGEFAEREFKALKDRLERTIDIYAQELAAFEEDNNIESSTGEEYDKYIERRNRFINYNSPYVASKVLSLGAPISVGNHKSNSVELPSVPRRFEKGSLPNTDSDVRTDYYNDEFYNVISNEAYYTAYRFYVDKVHQLNAMLPNHIKINNTDNYVPMIDKSFMDLLRTDEVSTSDELSQRFMDLYSHKRSTLTTIDPKTNLKQYKLDVAILNKERADVENKIKLESIVKKEELGRELTIDEKYDIRKEVINELTFRKSFDLPQILKLFNYQVEKYNHKVAKETVLTDLRRLLHNAKEVKKGPKGDSRSKAPSMSFKNAKNQLEYYIEMFYGHDRATDTQDRKFYSSADKKVKEKLDTILTNLESQGSAVDNDGNYTMDQEEYLARLEEVQDAYHELGQNLSIEQGVRSMLKYTQLKGMGYNYGAAVTNMLHGYISNTIEAKDGRIFNTQQLLKGYGYIMHGVAKFYSGGAINTDTANKMYNITSRYDIIGEVSSEIEFDKRTNKDRKRRRSWKDIYVLQNSSEYVNQAPVIIATMLNTKLKHIVNGQEKEINLYEATDNDGKLRKDLDIVNRNEWDVDNTDTNGQKFIDVMLKASQAISAIHGNYNKRTPTLMNSNAFIASLKQFKTWIFESAAQRIEAEKYDEKLQIRRKGRWRSGFMGITYANATKEMDFPTIMNTTVSDTMFVLGQTARRLVFMDTNLDGRFSEVDAANIRKNIAEAMITARIIAMGLAMTAILKAYTDDDEDTADEAALRYAINTVNRLRDDMTLYYNPTVIKNILGNSLPVLGVLNSMYQLLYGLYHLGMGTVTETGVYAGESEGMRYILKALPFGSKYQSSVAMTKQVMTVR